MQASRTHLKVEGGKTHKNRGDMLSPTEHSELWNTFGDSTWPSLPINSGIGNLPFHLWACDLFATLSGPVATVFRPLPPIQDSGC